MPAETARHSLNDALFTPAGSPLLHDETGAQARADVLGRARRLAARLMAGTLAPGDRVAILCTDPGAGITALLAVLMTPFCAVPLHPAAPQAVIGQVLTHSGARVLLSDRPAGADPAPQGPERIDVTALPADAPQIAPRAAPAETALAALLYTSGTTGAPKGVEITFGALEAMTERLVHDFFRVGPDDVLLMAAPLTNIYGLSLALTALRAGAGLSLLAQLRPDVLMQTLRRDRVTFLAGVPMLAGMMLRAAGDTPDPAPQLRRALLAGTRLDADLARAFAARFGAEVMTGYGMTEGVPLAMDLDVLARAPDAPAGAVGQVAPGVEMRIVGPDMAPVAPGAPGEILVRGAVVTPGYWQAPEATAAAFHEGWLRTGDIGRLEADGGLVLIDRLKEIIKSAGNTVYPSEVETVLKAHPGVADCAVVGRSHDSLEEVVVAYYVPAGGTPPEEAALKAWCAARLMAWQVPRRFSAVESFPMTASGKVARFRLGAAT